ncbi:MAG: DNA repair protein RadC [Bacilli bacterium]|nr:DNA repair protein RadC [Bacilli bacterium]
MKIKELPLEDRPREKALIKGIASLTESELLALIIGVGKPGLNALELSMTLLDGYGGLANLARAPYQSLLEYSGLSEGKTLRLMAAFELAKKIALANYLEENEEFTPEALYERYHPLLAKDKQERLFLLMASKKMKFRKEELLYKGTETEILFSIKEIMRSLLANYADRFVLVHNHPSGNPLPSAEDVHRSFILAEEMKELGITMLDHVIISQEGYFSLRENKLI